MRNTINQVPFYSQTEHFKKSNIMYLVHWIGPGVGKWCWPEPETHLTIGGGPQDQVVCATGPGRVGHLQPVYCHQRGEAPWEEPSGTWLQHGCVPEPESQGAPWKLAAGLQLIPQGSLWRKGASENWPSRKQLEPEEATGCAWAGRRRCRPWSGHTWPGPGHRRGVCPSRLYVIRGRGAQWDMGTSVKSC